MNTAVVSALIAKLTAGCGLVLLLPLLTALFGEEPVLPFIYLSLIHISEPTRP